MQSSIYLIIALVAFTAAKQLNVQPQVFSEPQSSLSSQNLEKRYITQKYTFYLTPDKINALQDMKNFEKSMNAENTQSTKERQLKQELEDEQQLKWYNRQFLPEEPQLEIRGIAAHDAFFQKQNSDSDIQQGNFNYNNLYLEEQPKEQKKEMQRFSEISKENLENYYSWQKEQEEKTQQESDMQKDDKRKPYLTTVSAKNQDDDRLNEQLKQQWNRILDHNREQLKSVSPAPKSQESKQMEKPEDQWNLKFEIEKEIENILRDHGAYEFAKQSGNSQAEGITQKLPILVHKEVSLTKHLPVTVVKNVKVPVPKPVFVPVPEPYEVKIPHPYPVPLHILQQIPVPYMRNQ